MLHDDIDQAILRLNNAIKAYNIAQMELEKATRIMIERGKKRELKLVVDNEKPNKTD